MHVAVIRFCGTVAALAVLIYTMALIFSAIDPAGIRMSAPVGSVLLTIAAVNTLIAVNGWQVRAGVRQETPAAAERIAAAVSLTVLGAMEQRMYKVAEHTAGTAHDQLVAAIREVAAGVSADLTDSLGGRVETWLGRAHTRGMIEEATGRPNGTVSSIARRGDPAGGGGEFAGFPCGLAEVVHGEALGDSEVPAVIGRGGEEFGEPFGLADIHSLWIATCEGVQLAAGGQGAVDRGGRLLCRVTGTGLQPGRVARVEVGRSGEGS